MKRKFKLMKNDEVKTEVDLMTFIIEQIVFGIHFNDQSLVEAETKLALVKSLFRELKITDEEIEQAERDDDGEILFKTPRDVAIEIMDNAVHDVDYYGQALLREMHKRDLIKEMLKRGNYQFAFEDVEKRVLQQSS